MPHLGPFAIHHLFKVYVCSVHDYQTLLSNTDSVQLTIEKEQVSVIALQDHAVLMIQRQGTVICTSPCASCYFDCARS